MIRPIDSLININYSINIIEVKTKFIYKYNLSPTIKLTLIYFYRNTHLKHLLILPFIVCSEIRQQHYIMNTKDFKFTLCIFLEVRNIPKIHREVPYVQNTMLS